jgi:hypothetical protein
MTFKELFQTDWREFRLKDVINFITDYQRYIYLFLILCVSFLIFIIEVKPNVESYLKKSAVLKDYNSLFESKQKKAMSKDTIESEIARLHVLVDEKETIFFSENDFNEFSINILPKIAASYNNKIKSVLYKNSKVKDSFLIYKLDFTVEGNFDGLLSLYNELELFSKVIKIDQFNIVLRHLDPLVLSTEVSLSLYGVKK